MLNRMSETPDSSSIIYNSLPVTPEMLARSAVPFEDGLASDLMALSQASPGALACMIEMVLNLRDEPPAPFAAPLYVVK